MASNRRQPAANPPPTDDLDGMRARIAELERREADHARSERVQDALYRIAEAASAATDLPAFYRTVHEIVGELMYARNLYIALYDAERGRMNYPYYVDDVDTDIPDPNAWEPFGEGQARGVTAYALRYGRPLRLDAPAFRRAPGAGEVEQIGVVTDEGTWLGVPLPAEGRNQGLLVVQSYDAAHGYSEADLDLLDVRRPARRVRAQPGPGDRGDAPAERRARADQRDRRRRSRSSSTSTRSWTSSASGSGRSSTPATCSSRSTTPSTA